VRHGETEANARRCFAESDEIPLTETGRAQARELALRLAREVRPTVLVSSWFPRARQTGEIIGSVLGLKLETIGGIQERNFGCLKGRPYEELGNAAHTWCPAGGESLDDVRGRAFEAIDSLRMRYPGERVVVVSHGAVIQAVCAHITGEWSTAVVPANCGMVTIRYEAAAGYFLGA
jgi:broad specificity phosphatase PhoE